MNRPLARTTDISSLARFWLRLAGWLGLYAALVIPWGAYNRWPGSLFVALGYTPLCLLVAAGLIRRQQFGHETPDPPSHWELLISFLLLTIGVASGYMLVMSVGWVCVGVAWLRPARSDLAWNEWYKLPVLFLFCLPVMADLAGSRHDWFLVFGSTMPDSGAPADWLATERGKILVRLALLALAWFVSGTGFWVCATLLPLPFLLAHFMATRVPGSWPEFILWALPAGGVAMAIWIVRAASRRRESQGHWFSQVVHELKHRSHALWLAALVTLMQQQSLAESWLAGGRPKLDLTGATLLLLTLLVMRLATPPAAVDFRSRVTLIASQLILFAAEFTDLNPLRHAALGVFLVAALSWGRNWNWVLLGGASACWIATLPATEAVLIMAGLGANNAALLRLGGFIVSIIMVIGAASQAVSSPTEPSSARHDWQPEQRFVFTLLGLLLIFQTLSAFSPDGGSGKTGPEVLSSPTGAGYDIRRLESVGPRSAWARYQVLKDGQSFELRIRPVDEAPMQTTSTELVLRGEGWSPEERRLVSHDFGQVATMDIRQGRQTAHAVYWFQHGRRTFVNHLRARRILWSSWNLNRRDLRFFLLVGETPVSNEDLLEFARLQKWFLTSP